MARSMRSALAYALDLTTPHCTQRGPGSNRPATARFRSSVTGRRLGVRGWFSGYDGRTARHPRRRRRSWRAGTYEDLPMKPDVHRQHHLIKVVMTYSWDQELHLLHRSQAGYTLHLHMLPTGHPAWTGGARCIWSIAAAACRASTQRFGGGRRAAAAAIFVGNPSPLG